MTTARTISDHFDATADAAPTRIAVKEDDHEISYQSLQAWSQTVSCDLEALGLAEGQRVGLMVPNSAAYVAAFHGIARCGGVVAPLNTRYRTQELVYYLGDTSAAALVVTPDLVEAAQEALAQLEDPPSLLVINRDQSCRTLSEGSAAPPPAASTDSPALLHQYTSGSTGAPKRVIRTHSQLSFELERLAAVFDLGEDDRLLGAAPFTHVNGLVRTMMTSMYVGGRLYPVAKFARRGALETISRERITYFGAVPYMFVILANTPRRGEIDLSSIRTAFSASAPLLPDDNQRFHENYGVTIRQLYGSTETGTISVNTHDDPLDCMGSVGMPLPDVRVEIVDENKQPVGPDVEGEVAISSPCAIDGYEGNPEANASSFHEGFYLSGDLGRKAPDGCITLTGRKKFLINRGGYKVNPLEVEEAILSMDKVAEVAVVGAPGPHGDDIVRCVVVPAGECNEQDIVDHCKPRIADFKIPSRIEFAEELPKSETGKLLRHKL